MSSEKRNAKPYIFGAFTFLLPLLFIFLNGIKVNTNILDLLPGFGQEEKVEASIKHFTEKLSANHIFLIKHNDWETAKKAAQDFQRSLEESALFREILGRQSESKFNNWYKLYFPHRYYLLTDKNHQLLENHDIDNFLKNRLKKLYSPQASLYTGNLEKDPLLLFGEFIQNLPSPGRLNMKDGFLFKEKDGVFYLFINAGFKESVFSASVQKEFRDVLNRFQKDHLKVEVLQLGFFPYAERARSQAEWEISFIGTGSVIGILLLFLFVFRSIYQLIITLTTIGIGILWGLMTTQFIYGDIHIITIVFGATLTGVCVDYAFHWLCSCFDHDSGSEQHIQKGILWGSLTSLIAYGGLCLTGFPGLTQIAVFSCSGIIVSVLLVLLTFPELIKKRSPKGAPALSQIYDSFPTVFIKVFPVLIFLVAVPGFFKISSSDDIRQLQDRPEDLLAKEHEVKELVSSYENSRFILVSDSNDNLLTEGKILKKIDGLADTFSLSQLLPPVVEQEKSYQLIKSVVDSQKFTDYCQDLGFSPGVVEQTKKDLLMSKPLTLENFLRHPASREVKHLASTENGKLNSIILLQNIKNEDDIRTRLKDLKETHYINRVADTTEVMKIYREKAVFFTVASYFLILILLFIKFEFKKALAIILPPVLAAVCTCGLLSLSGISLNLFNILAFMLILGIGIDYSIFVNLSGSNSPGTSTAIALSAISTLLAFGLLAFSATPALQTFGLTMAVGIVLSFSFAPLGIKIMQNLSKA